MRRWASPRRSRPCWQQPACSRGLRRRGRRRPARPDRSSARRGARVRRGLEALRLAGRLGGRPTLRAVPPARHGRRGARRPGPRLAHDPTRHRVRRRPRRVRRRRAVVGRADRGRWRGRGGEAARLRGPGRPGLPRAAGAEVLWARVPAAGPRLGVYPARAPGAAARARPWGQAPSRSRSSPSAWRPCTASSRVSRCAACTSAPSACSRWRASRWIPGCERVRRVACPGGGAAGPCRADAGRLARVEVWD